MLLLGILLAAFGASAAIDLSGCRPSPPKYLGGLHQLTGEITSPGFKEGQNYPDNIMCAYFIKAPFGFRIKLTFLDMDIEHGDMCMRDAIEITELGRQRLTLGVFCGNQTFQPLIVSSNEVSIVFRSDFMIGGRGFRIKYSIAGTQLPCDLGKVPCKNRNCFSPRLRCDGKDDCGDGTDEERCGMTSLASECGVRKIKGNFADYDRVIGGREAVPGSWPWQADLQLGFIHPNGHTCGGTLINSQWVVTAAHCFMQFRHPMVWRIHLGNHNKYVKDPTEQIRNVERIIVYPGITGNDLLRAQEIDMKNDLALIKLNAPVKITDAVRPACLPKQGLELPVGTKCMGTGWGITRGTGSNHALKEVDLTVQHPRVCNGQTGPITLATMICVKNMKGYQDVCHGDSGGPLVCELNGKWHLMGATSYGSEGNYLGGLCAMSHSATIYSKVSHKTNWINQQINRYS